MQTNTLLTFLKSGNSVIFIYICNTLKKSLENLSRQAAHQQVHLYLFYFRRRSRQPSSHPGKKIK